MCIRDSSKHLPHRLAKFSPVVGRVLVDGDYLRAMFGSAWLLLCSFAIAIGLLVSSSTGWYATPPSLGLFLLVLGVGVFDSTLGFLAGMSFIVGALFAGHLGSANEVRLAMGLALVWFAVPLAAAALRPLRRRVTLDREEMCIRDSASTAACFVAECRRQRGFSPAVLFHCPSPSRYRRSCELICRSRKTFMT